MPYLLDLEDPPLLLILRLFLTLLGLLPHILGTYPRKRATGMPVPSLTPSSIEDCVEIKWVDDLEWGVQFFFHPKLSIMPAPCFTQTWRGTLHI